MFDRLIESTSLEAGPTPRRRYFVTCAVVLGILFLGAVIASLYAADIDLGVDQFEIAMVVAPITPEVPEPAQPAQQRASAPQTAELPSRQTNTLRPDESPLIPDKVSTTQNTQLARPATQFIINGGPERDPLGSRPPTMGRTCTDCAGTSSSADNSEIAGSTEPETIPPPPVTKTEPPRARSIGVVNGIAKSLPKPAYPPPALAVGAQGKVDVQVTIDEEGRVISAKAASGHPLLRQAAERAAWQARFTPTLLSKVPVKVTGVIVYNFTR